MFASDCELEGPLEISLGHGLEQFVALPPLDEPTVHQGNQGGHHLCLGLRVANPALDYPLLKVSFDAEFNDPQRCQDQPDCDPWVNTGRRELVLGPELPLTSDGSVEQAGFILLISLWPDSLERRVRLSVVDPCRREGAVEHIIAPAAEGGT